MFIFSFFDNSFKFFSKILSKLILQVSILSFIFAIFFTNFFVPSFAESKILTKPNGELEIMVNGIEKIERNEKDCTNFGKYKEGKSQKETQLEIKTEQEKCGQNQTLQLDEFLVLIDMTIWNKSDNNISYFGDLKMNLSSGQTELRTDFDSIIGIGSRELPKFSRFLASSDRVRGKVFWKVKNNDQNLDYKLKVTKFRESTEINLGKINKNNQLIQNNFTNPKNSSNENFEIPKNAKILKFTQNQEISQERNHYKTGQKLNYQVKIESLGCQDFAFPENEQNNKYLYEKNRLKIGYKYLKCQTIITNQSNFTQNLDSKISVKDKNGQTFESLNEGLFSKFSFYDNLLPNDKILSESYFEVPQNFGEFRLYITSPFSWDKKNLTIFEN